MTNRAEHVPIIFIHNGTSSYLWCTLWQAHVRNPHNEIVLIGNRDPRLPFVVFENVNKYAEVIRPFREVYVPLSTNPILAQRHNLEQWLILNAYVKGRNLQRFVHADSDLMMYCRVDDYFDRFAGYPWAMGHTSAHSGHMIFVLDVAVLERFCQFIMDMYLDLELFGRIYKHYRWHRENIGDGGIGDMAAMSFFIDGGHTTSYDLNRVVDGAVFDQAIRDPRLTDRSVGYQTVNGIKTVEIIDGNPHFRALDGTAVRALTLHFQGSTKHLMRKYVEAPSKRISMEYANALMLERVHKKADRAFVLRKHYTEGVAKRMRRLMFGGQRK